jgi:hypothetical protein
VNAQPAAPEAEPATGERRLARAWQHHWGTIRRRSAFLGRIARRPDVALRPCRYLFVLSHMRSRSTLLGHLLGSHPEISGYLETHLRYRRRRDFQKLRYAIAEARGGAPLRRWVMDKVLHRSYLDLELLERMRVVPLLLLRDPEGSLPSLRPFVPGGSFERAALYYERQLQWMEEVAVRFGRRALFVRSDAILDQTRHVLRFLEEALALSSPLEDRYRIFERTGDPYAGDYSPLIRTGRVVRGERSCEQPSGIPRAVAERAQAQYERCLAALERTCRHPQISALAPGPGAQPDAHATA